jgi:DNA-binding FrmR family transcriptional regulator
MEEAQESLRVKDMDALRERLKRVRGHIEKLYRML